MDLRHLLCFVDGITDEQRFERLLERFEQDGWQVHLLSGVNEHALLPHQLPTIMDSLFPEGTDGLELSLLSNVPDFLALLVRLFPRSFRRTLLYAGEIADYTAPLEPVYRCLLERGLEEAEGSPRPVYAADGTAADLLPDWLRPYVKPLDEISQDDEAAPVRGGTVSYALDGILYRFEPLAGAAARIVNLGGGAAPDLQTCFNTVVCGQQWVGQETIAMLRSMDKSKQYFLANHSAIARHFDALAARLREEPPSTRAFLEISLELAANSMDRYGKAFMLSFLMKVCRRAYYQERLLDLLLQDEGWTWEEQYFYLWQCRRIGFVNSAVTSSVTSSAGKRLYRGIYQRLKRRFEEEYLPIPSGNRNPDLVVVITGQFLGMGHGPTKTALDRCYTLVKHLGKQVVLLNSREVMTMKGVSPFYQITVGNAVAELSDVSSMQYKDISIPYYQPNMDMPDLDGIRLFLDFIRQNKPEFIVSIGGMNLTADLCDMMVPVVVVNTVPSGLPLTESRFLATGRPVKESEWPRLHEFGFGRENVIESLFTYDFKPQEHQYTRAELGLPEDRFLVAVVGARLDLEVTDEFLDAVLGSHPRAHLVFIGVMDKYEALCTRHPRLGQASTMLGFQSDVLAVLEVCDLYANPRRSGGGTSAAEALYKGVPVVTLNFGDVSYAAGRDFAVESYEEMTAAIRRYVEDERFYADMSAKGKERAARLLSTETEFLQIVNTVRSSPLFG